METAALAVRIAVGMLLIGASISKFRRPAEFAEAVSAYHVVPPVLARRIASSVPLVEAAVGSLLLLGILPAAGLLLAAFIITVFAVAVAINLLRGRDIDCGCGGLAASKPISAGLVFRNAVLATACGLASAVVSDSFALYAPDANTGAVSGAQLLALSLSGGAVLAAANVVVTARPVFKRVSIRAEGMRYTG